MAIPIVRCFIIFSINLFSFLFERESSLPSLFHSPNPRKAGLGKVETKLLYIIEIPYIRAGNQVLDPSPAVPQSSLA